MGFLFYLPDDLDLDQDLDLPESSELLTESEEMQVTTSDVQSQTTTVCMNTAVHIFRQFLKDNKHPTEFETYTTEELCAKLKEFYMSARTIGGRRYKNNSLNSLRSLLGRYLRQKSGSSIDIVHGPEFEAANAQYRYERKQNKDRGPRGIDAITDADLVKLYQDKHVFNTERPAGLQRKVWFELVYYLCRKEGKRNFRQLKPSDFKIGEDSKGRYVYRVGGRGNKVVGGRGDKAGCKMYSTGSRLCPVASFEKYVSLLSQDCPCLFQQVNAVKEDPGGYCWYMRVPVGEKRVGNLMRDISKQANLSQVYNIKSVQSTPVESLQLCVYNNPSVPAAVMTTGPTVPAVAMSTVPPVGALVATPGGRPHRSILPAPPVTAITYSLSETGLPYVHIKPDSDYEAKGS